MDEEDKVFLDDEELPVDEDDEGLAVELDELCCKLSKCAEDDGKESAESLKTIKPQTDATSKNDLRNDDLKATKENREHSFGWTETPPDQAFTRNIDESCSSPIRQRPDSEEFVQLERPEREASRLSSARRSEVPTPQNISSAVKEAHQSPSSAEHTSKAQSIHLNLKASSDSSSLSTPQHRRHSSQRTIAGQKNVRKIQINHPLPDFSSVQPRVRLPKSSYKPPANRGPPYNKDSKPEALKILQRTESNEIMFHQLQDDYSKLLTKCAEGQNTIDQLRFEAKVGLHYEHPTQNHPVLSGVLQEGSKVMTLCLPQAQRVELSTNTVLPTIQTLSSGAVGDMPTHSCSVEPISPRSSGCQAGTALTEALSKHTQRFQLQVDEFEKLLKSGKLHPHEQIQGLFSLTQQQDCLERTYMAALDRYKQLQKQTGGESGPFDPDRKLEGLIFHSGTCLEELKEYYKQSKQSQPTSETGPSAASHQPCGSLKETQPLAECVKKDFSNLKDQRPIADSLSGQSTSSCVCNSKETLSETHPPVSVLPGQQGRVRRAEGSGRSHSGTRWGRILKKKTPEESGRTLNSNPEDGVISPETDSGFVGSESSQLTLAAHRPVQQRAARSSTIVPVSSRVMRPSVTQERCRIKPDTVSLSGQPAPHSSAHTLPSLGQSGGLAVPSGRASVSAVSSSSTLRWSSSHLQPWTSSDGVHSLLGKEVQQGEQYTQPTNQASCFIRSHSFTVRNLHSDHFKAQSETFRSLHADMARLKEQLEGCLRRWTPSSPVRVPPSVMEDFGESKPPHVFTPQQSYFRPKWEASRRGVRDGMRSGEENQERGRRVTPAPRRSVSLSRFSPELHSSIDSEHTHSEPKPQTSKYIPTIPVLKNPTRRTRAETRRRAEAQISTNSVRKEAWSVRSTPRQRGSVYLAAAPPLLGSVSVLQYVPVCPLDLCCSNLAVSPSPTKPVYISLREDKGHRSGVKGHHRLSHIVYVQCNAR